MNELKLTAPKILESDIKKTIKNYLNAKGIFNFHLLAGMGAFKGAPDRIAVMKTGEVLFIEVKAEKGVQSDYQKEFQFNIESRKNIYLLARKVEDVILKVKEIEGRYVEAIK
jgi:hypothetical protein